MMSAAIFCFLVGAVLAWAFRVWILFPLSIFAFLLGCAVDIASDVTFVEASGRGLLVGMMPQFGYAFGLLARSTLTGLRAPLRPNSRTTSTSVAVLYKKNATKRLH